MKTFFFFIALTFTSIVYSQGNLQFNRIVLYNLTGSATLSGMNTIQTVSIVVPTGKVLKIESATTRINGTVSYYYGGSNPSQSFLLLNNNIIMYNYTTANYIREQSFPIWLPEGTHTLSLVGGISGYAGQIAYGMVTGIEFNIVP